MHARRDNIVSFRGDHTPEEEIIFVLLCKRHSAYIHNL